MFEINSKLELIKLSVASRLCCKITSKVISFCLRQSAFQMSYTCKLSEAKTIIVIRWHLDGRYTTGYVSFVHLNCG